jgi:magnesium transporter
VRKDLFLEDGFHALLEDKVPLLKSLLSDTQNRKSLKSLIEGMHPSEIAYLIQYLEVPYRETFVSWLKPTFNPEVFLFLAHNLRSDIIELLSPQEIIAILDVLESDDALSLLASLEEDQRKAVLKAMPEDKSPSYIQRLSYPESSAGRLMQQEVLFFPEHWTVKQSLEYITHAENLPENCYDAFVVDEHRHPTGVISLGNLIKSAKHLKIQEVMTQDVRTIPAQWDQEEVAFMFRLYDLMSAPVVNTKGELIGMITADDVIDVMERKATEDLLHMGRIHSSDFYDSVLKTSFSRIYWLIVTLLNTLLTSLVINEFQETLQEKVVLTILMPVAAAMGGNTGIQATTIAIRALATKELTHMNMVRSFIKEFRVALLNGAIFGLLLGAIVWFWFHDFRFSCVLGGAVIFNMAWAGLVGTVLPVIITRLGHDPALSAGPLLTTTTDVIGYAVFLGLAKYMMS